MTLWENFEIACAEYLNTTFGNYANFVRQGGSDSTVPDILVKTSRGTSFYIDAKLCPAQSGQFVLLPDITTNTFQYSSLNSNQINAYTQKIMDHMNKHFEDFKEAGTRGKKIFLDDGDDTFAKWIIHTYKSSGVEYIITNHYTILPVSDFQRHFVTTAIYRIKRSGSTNVGIANLIGVADHIQYLGYIVSGTRSQHDKLFVKSQFDLDKNRFTYQGYEYMFSLRDDEFEIRKLSNTFNANVIFSITKKQATGLTKEQFCEALK